MTPIRSLGIAAIAVAVAACATSAGPRVVDFPSASARPVDYIQGILNYDVALATIDTVFRDTFDFPPIPATVQFVPGERAFEQTLKDAGYDDAFARDTARRMRAVALHRRVLVNEAAMADSSWAGRVGTLAHELVHCLQYDLAGGRRGTSEQWIREGVAEWISLRVLEHLQAFAPGAAQRWLVGELNASNRSAAPRLDDMMTFRQWVALAGRRDIVPHVQAVLSVDLLIERHGLATLWGYFERFAAREDPEGNFLAAFGQSRAEFERDVDARLGLRR